jgi:glycosyltransferase involved in cell wall biosynthesis
MSEPLVSVILSAHNASSFIGAALESICHQTFKNIEVIVIDDASTDATKDVVKAYASLDERLQLIENGRNMGLAHSLNKGCATAKGDFICRLDADDIAHRHRLERQVTRFEQKPDLLLLGTNGLYVTEGLRPLYPSRLPIQDWDIRCTCLIMNPFLHSSVMMRSDVFGSLGLTYNESLNFAQDWDLWVRVQEKGAVENLQERLVMIRTHSKSLSKKFQTEQMACGLKIQEKYVKNVLSDQEWDEAVYRGLYQGFLGIPRSDKKLAIDSIKSSSDALAILSSVLTRYSDRKCQWFIKFILGRSLWVCVTQAGRPGWTRLVKAIGGFRSKNISAGVLWLIQFLIVTAYTRLSSVLKVDRTEKTNDG